MKKIILYVAVLALISSSVMAATECASYFTKSDDRRAKIVNYYSSLDLTSDRFQRVVENLYSSIDDLDHNENLTDLDGDFDDLVSKKNDVSDDMRSVTNAISDYDSALTSARKDLPAACFKTFYVYDDDISLFKDWNRDVKKEWDRAVLKYDIVAAFNSHLSTVNSSYALPRVDDLVSATDDFTSAVQRGFPNKLNGTGIANGTAYSETECFAMVTKNVDIAVKECNSKLKALQALNCTAAAVNKTNVTCPTCPKCNVTSSSDAMRLRECEANVVSLRAQLDVKSINTCGPTETQLASLQNQYDALKAVNANISRDNANLKRDLEAASNVTCPSTLLPWGVAIGLIILIILAWIVAL